MLARFRIDSPAATSAPPIQLAMIGLPDICARTAPIAARSRWGRSWPAASGSPAARRCWGPARPLPAPWHSEPGRRRPARPPGCCGSNAPAGIRLKVSIVSGESSASSPPDVSSSSVASTPGPPALVTMVRRGPFGPRLLGQDLGHVEQIQDGVHPQHAAAPKRRFQHFIAAGQRAGVRGRRLGRPGRAPRLDDDDGLGQRHFARRRHERPARRRSSPCR